MSRIITDKKSQTQTKLLLIEVKDIEREDDVLASYDNYSQGVKEGDVIHKAGSTYRTVKAIFAVPARNYEEVMVARDVRVGLTISYGNEINPSNRYFLERSLGLTVPKFETAKINADGDWLDGLSIDDKINQSKQDALSSDLEDIDFDNLERELESETSQTEMDGMILKLQAHVGKRFRVKIVERLVNIQGKDISYQTFDMSTLILDPKFNDLSSKEKEVKSQDEKEKTS